MVLEAPAIEFFAFVLCIAVVRDGLPDARGHVGFNGGTANLSYQ